LRNLEGDNYHNLMKENEYEKSLKEEVLPWANTEEDYVLAITGSAYSYIVSTEN
jgi:hypothetical protein